MDTTVRSNPLRRRLRRLGRFERSEEAAAFVDIFHRENGLADKQRQQRRRQVVREVLRYGFYEHLPEELAYGARVAWRNHARCIGRLLWQSLDVVDCRDHTSPDDVAARAVEHLREATGSGAIRSIISVFPPVRSGRFHDELPPYIESSQLVQYAGYATPGGRVVGDPLNVEMTRNAIALGWHPPSDVGHFDLLPLIVRDKHGRRIVYELPNSAMQEVEISHPRSTCLDLLGLRWYTVPCVSSMILTIGGLDYPCAPFNGYYMGTEIASRNLGDERRYDLLPAVAEVLGIDRDPIEEPLWKDRALTELNAAVLYSFRRDGVTIIDHHSASEQYMQFVQREEASGRSPSADWAWVVPPEAAASLRVFHLRMRDRRLVPNYYTSRATDGAGLGPAYDDELRSRFRSRWDRVRRRCYDWTRRIK